MNIGKSVRIFIAMVVALPLLTSCEFNPANFSLATVTPYPSPTTYPTFTSYPTPLPSNTPEDATPSITPFITSAPNIVPSQQTTEPTRVIKLSTTPVTWKNETSHQVKIVATGPNGSYTLSLGAGEEKLVNWNVGDYTVTYYLDGNSSSAGKETLTLNDEEHKLLTLNFR